MQKGFSQFNDELKAATDKFPKLKIKEKDGVNILSGTFDIIIEDDEVIDSYEIEIHPVRGFPFQFPRLYEVGGKIPRESDWHIYENTGHCCITVPMQEAIWCKNGITVTQFIQHHVRPFLYNQTYRRIHGIYANGEYSHGMAGIWEFYVDLFKENNKRKIIHHLSAFVNSNDKVHKKSRCFCGSSSKMRKCHPDVYKLFHTIPKKVLKLEIKQLSNDLQNPAIRQLLYAATFDFLLLCFCKILEELNASEH